MIIAIPREIKESEYRVALTPQAVKVLVEEGHSIIVEENAGQGSGILNEEYSASGAEIVPTAEELYGRADMVVKVKEPQAEEYPLLKAGQKLFCYLHLASDSKLVDALCNSGVEAVAFETIQLEDGTLPLLAPMSRIAGRLSIQVGMKLLEKPLGGKGILMGGAPGVPPAKVLIIGGGTVGYNAAAVALSLGAQVTIIEKQPQRLNFLYDRFGSSIRSLPSFQDIINSECGNSDLIIGSVLIPGARSPKLVTEEIVRNLEPGTVLVDVAIDQGGCFETSRPTTHSDPIYSLDGVIHYCVTNMPSIVSRTSTFYLSNEILPYVVRIASEETDNPAIQRGINVKAGKLFIEI